MKISQLFASFDAKFQRNTANTAFRSVHTSMLGSIVNQLVNEFHQSGTLQPRNETDEKLQGLKSLELIAELEAKEQELDMSSIGSPYGAPIDIKLQLEQKFCILKVAEVAAKRTAAVGNRFERPMDLASWLRFVLGASTSNAAVRDQLTAAIVGDFGFEAELVKQLSSAVVANERRRIDQAVPHIIAEFKRLDRMYPRIGDFDDLDTQVFPDSTDRQGQESDTELYWAYAFSVKVFNKVGGSIDKTVNNALKFTNLSMLTDARLMKGDMAAALQLVLEAENDADEILSAMMDFNLPMIDSSYVTKHAQ